MEELLSNVKRIVSLVSDIENEWDMDFKNAIEKITKIAQGEVNNDSSMTNNKRIKPLKVISDIDENVNNTEINQSSTPPENPIRNSITSRPMRAARLKNTNSFREPSLTKKLRRPSGNEDSHFMASIKIKKEKISVGQSLEKSKSNETLNSKRKSQEENDKDDTKLDGPAKKVKVNDNNSLEIISNQNSEINLISDDECEKMPPPINIPKKKKVRKTKQSDISGGIPFRPRSCRIRIKNEKLSLNSEINNEHEILNGEQIKENENNNKKYIEETYDQQINKISESGAIPKTKKKFVKVRPIKVETFDVFETPLINKTITKNTPFTRNLSQESVYEDALNGCNDNFVSPIENNELKTSSKQSKCNSASIQTAFDATFISAQDVQVQQIDATFTKDIAQDTFILKNENKENDTKIIKNNQIINIDATFTMNKENDQNQIDNNQNDNYDNSLLTEDNSEDDKTIPIPTLFKSKLNAKELFNPCIQSPVKKKVEAFEKHAAASPVLTRTTRLRNILAKENKAPEIQSIHKPLTPSIGRLPSKLLTPTQLNTFRIGGVAPQKVLGNSTTKAANTKKLITKPLSVTSNTKSLPRNNSVEDLKKITNKLQPKQIEEKKKVREQKQILAAQVREAKEKERTDKILKTMQEREEKIRKKAIENQQLKKDEENIKYNKNNDEIRERFEKQKQLEQEMAEMERNDREAFEKLKLQKAKEILDRKMLQHKKALKHQKEILATKLIPKYGFDMLHSDDSTDEEEKVSTKRPPPPSWSKPSIRQFRIEAQTYMDTNIIDRFFSVQAMTPDLKEIFPKIDPKYLKRNSSVVWNTPPRYSELPKY